MTLPAHSCTLKKKNCVCVLNCNHYRRDSVAKMLCVTGMLFLYGSAWGADSLGALPQEDVDEPVDEGESSGHPRDDVGVPKVARIVRWFCGGVLAGVHRSGRDHAQTGQQEDAARDDEAAALLEAIELEDEEAERQAGQDDGQDHESLDRLQPRFLSLGGCDAIPDICSLYARLPQVKHVASIR